MSSPALFFRQFLSDGTRGFLMQGLEKYSITFAIELLDTGTSWILTINEGKLIAIDSDMPAQKKVAVKFVLTQAVFNKIIHNEITPQRAFFTKQAAIDGDVIAGMKLAKILSLVLKTSSYHMPRQEVNDASHP